MTVRRYDGDATTWDALIASSEVDAFLFRRAFMDYHRDRFADHSLVFTDEAGVVAILPAHLDGKALVSHGGLTFGGLIFRRGTSFSKRLATYRALHDDARAHGLERIVFKTCPDYARLDADQTDAHALVQVGARLIRSDTSFVIDRLGNPPEVSSRRRRGLKEAARAGVRVETSTDFAAFWTQVLEPNLRARFGATPVHTADEITRLAGAFPDGIRLLIARGASGEPLAGLVLFVNVLSAHTQYISSTPAGREVGALDALVHFAATEAFAEPRYFSLGTVNGEPGHAANVGLAEWKSEFGARVFAHHVFELDVREAKR